MLKSGEEFFNIHWHGYVHMTLLVVPFEIDPAVECTVPILLEFVCVRRASMRRSACSFRSYLIPKSSTVSVN